MNWKFKKTLWCFTAAFSIFTAIGANPSQACTIPSLAVNTGSNTTPPVTSIVGIVADGTSLLTVFNRNFTTGVVTQSFFNLGNAGDITATGSFGGPSSIVRATSWAASGNKLTFNGRGGGVITFTNMTVSGSGAFNGGGASGLSRLLSSPDGTAVGFTGYNANVNLNTTTPMSAVGTCTVVGSVSGGISGTINLNATLAAEATQAEFFVDGVIAGSATGAPYTVPFNTANLANGIHTLTVVGTFPNGTVVAPAKTFAVFNSMISAATFQTCAVWQGAAKCWGGNPDGQLGNNSTIRSLQPVTVSGLSSGVTQISSGSRHGCAVANGAAKCWGDNQFGQLGNGTTTDSLVPVQVTGLTSGVTQIAAGDGLTCALTTAGAVKCWGRGSFGALGNGSTANSSVPVQVTGMTSGIQMVSVGVAHACAVLANKTVKCWGYNVVGQLGNNTTTDSSTPVSIANEVFLTNFVSAGSYYTCVDSGRCWGVNSQGCLGNNSTANSSVPVVVQSLAGTFPSAGNAHSCAMTTIPNQMKCWGWNDFAQLGNGTLTGSLVPVTVSGSLTGLRSISAGNQHTCAHLGTGIKCWGNNLDGKLGTGNTTGSNVPVSVVGL